MEVTVPLVLSALLIAACAPVEPQPAPVVPSDPATPEAQMVEDLAALRFDALGNEVLRWDAVPAVRASKEEPQRLVVLLVEFADVGFDRFAGATDQGEQLAAYYTEQLFDERYAKKDTLSHYYATQSDGRYHVTGQVLTPVKLTKPLSAYGSPTRPEGGDWRNDTATEDLIEEALAAARAQQPELDWSAFDTWDPQDADGDELIEEPDGYIDHLVLIYAGRGQHSCQSLYKLNDKLNANASPAILDELSEAERACADRLWPHRSRVKRRESKGPQLGETVHAAGGIPLSDSLWVADYNMQCEYTGADTFIHEFGHSIGLPDVYARSASNSTGPWEVMSSTASPAQSLSAWSRTQLGWMEPTVVRPPAFGGEPERTLYLGAVEDVPAEGVTRGVLVALPPKTRTIDLVGLAEGSAQALYSGQGNDLNRTARWSLDLTGATSASLAFDAWWSIEAGWDFAYVEVSTDGGASWTRVVEPTHMPAKHGHDGTNTLPGFTGMSGDLDGDGKNESHPQCDPTAELATGEDRAGAADNPCEASTWVRASLDLTPFVGAEALVRWRYYTDGAAVEPGLLLDDVTLTVDGAERSEDFEQWPPEGWELEGFSASSGHHELLVPHYYMLEYRDPDLTGPDRYDHTLAKGGFSAFFDPESDQLGVMYTRARPGVVAWYVDGAYAWSENDPGINGPGKGYLLTVDAWPNELLLPHVAAGYRGDRAAFDTHYVLDALQPSLEEAYYRTLCAVRPEAYVPVDVDAQKLETHCGVLPDVPPIQALELAGKPARFSYAVNDLLPGEAQDAYTRIGELHDIKQRRGETIYRLRDRGLRYAHTLDSPFSAEPFADGRVLYHVIDGELMEVAREEHPAVARFSDADASRWQNPELPFGGVIVPQEGLSFEVRAPGPEAPEGTRAELHLSWAQNE